MLLSKRTWAVMLIAVVATGVVGVRLDLGPSAWLVAGLLVGLLVSPLKRSAGASRASPASGVAGTASPASTGRARSSDRTRELEQLVGELDDPRAHDDAPAPALGDRV